MPTNIKQSLIEGLWMEIENAVFMSEQVRTSLEKLRAWDPKVDI
jgi:hypothetical protein